MAVFSSMVMDHFMHPRHAQPLSAPSGEGAAGSVEQGRYVRMQVVVQRDIIQDAAFSTVCCVPAIAAGSYLTEWAIGRSVQETQTLTPQDLQDQLGGLPAARSFYAELAVQALQAAIEDAGFRAVNAP